MKYVSDLDSEEQLGIMLINDTKSKKNHLTLNELGYKQPPTPIHSDNSTTVRPSNKAIKNAQELWI